MSQAEYYVPDMRWGAQGGAPTLHDRLARAASPPGGRATTRSPGGMIETAENLRREYAISREEQDELAAALAPAGGRRQRGGPVRRRDRRRSTVSAAQGRALGRRPRRAPARRHHAGDAGPAAPIMGSDDPEATVTAGNASGQNDGAAVCDRDHTARRPSELGLRPLARLVGWARRRRRAADAWASARCRPAEQALERSRAVARRTST